MLEIVQNYFREQKRKKAIKKRKNAIENAIEKRKNAIEKRKNALNNVTINDARKKGRTSILKKADSGFSDRYMINIEEYPQTPYDFLCIIVSMFSLGEYEKGTTKNILKPMYLSYSKIDSHDSHWYWYSFTIRDKNVNGMLTLNQYVCKKENQNMRFDKNEEIIKLKTLTDRKIDIEYYTLSVDFVKTHIFEYKDKDKDKCIFSFKWGDDNKVTLNVSGNEIVQGHFYFYYTYSGICMTLTLRVLLPETFQSAKCNIKF